MRPLRKSPQDILLISELSRKGTEKFLAARRCCLKWIENEEEQSDSRVIEPSSLPEGVDALALGPL